MKLLNRLLLAALVLPLCSPGAAAQEAGTVFTTTAFGVPQIVFRTKPEVYLAGGPGPLCSGAGLVDGLHYFQVTNPSGSLLLSKDPLENRQVLVRNGVIVAATPGRNVEDGPCSSKVVQLINFRNVNNRGGEYKVWLTPVSAYAPGEGAHGFLSSNSKTANFKVGIFEEPQTVIRGRVFYDLDEDGLFDPLVDDEALPGWRVSITSNASIDFAFTDQDGAFEFIRPTDGAVYVLDSLAPAPGFVGIVGGRWLPTAPVQVAVVADVPQVEAGFGNLFLESTPAFARSKGYWHNQGSAELAACDPLWREALNQLCLRTNVTNPAGEQGTLFTLSLSDSFQDAFAQLSSYLVAPTFGVLANILSVQYAAANLNKSCGPLAGVTTYIDRFEDGVLVSFESMSAVTLELLCNPRSANTGPGGDEEWRQMIMMCLNEWVGMNSDGDSIYTRRPQPPGFITPY